MSKLFKVLAVSTAVVAVIAGVAMVGHSASAATPAQFGLMEGDRITAHDSAGDPDIYIINDWGYRRLILNPIIASFYGHLGTWPTEFLARTKQVSAATRDAFIYSGLFRNCEINDPKVYAYEFTGEDTGVIHWVNISGAAAVSQDPNFFLKVFCINNNEFNWFAKSPVDYTNTSQIMSYSRYPGVTPTPSTSPVVGFNPNGGTQGAIDSLSLGSPAKSEALEGQSSVEIYAVDAKTTNDGPLLLTSADVWFSNSDDPNSDTKPWSYFTTVKLLVGGQVVATKTTSSLSDWSDVVNPGTQLGTANTIREYRLRFTGLSALLPSDMTTSISAAVSVVSTIDSVDQSAVWVTELGEIRVLDESGLTVTENTSANGSTTLEDSFTTGAADLAALTVADAPNMIPASVIKVSDTVDTNGVPIYSFTMEETNDVAVDIDSMVLSFLTSDTLADVYRRAYIFEGTTQKGSEAVTASTTFDNLGIHLNAGQKKTFFVKVDLKDTNNQANYQDGDTLSTNVDDISLFTDENGNDEGDITESISGGGDTHELRVDAINLALISTSISKTYSRDPAVASDSDQATAYIKFSVTADGSDAYVDKSAPLVEVATSDGESALAVTGTPVVSATITADDTISGEGVQGFKVLDGSTRNFTVTVVMTDNDHPAGEFVDVSLIDLCYMFSDLDCTLNYTFNLDNYKTNQVFIQSTP